MTFSNSNLIDGYVVEYREHSNTWVLKDEQSRELIVGGSLKTLREWVGMEEKKLAYKVVFTPISAIYFDPDGVGAARNPTVVIITGKPNETDFLISIPGDEGKRVTQAKVFRKYLYEHTVDNLAIVEFAKIARGHLDDAEARLKTLTPFVK